MGTFRGGPYSKDSSILTSRLGFPYVRKLLSVVYSFRKSRCRAQRALLSIWRRTNNHKEYWLIVECGILTKRRGLLTRAQRVWRLHHVFTTVLWISAAQVRFRKSLEGMRRRSLKQKDVLSASIWDFECRSTSHLIPE